MKSDLYTDIYYGQGKMAYGTPPHKTDTNVPEPVMFVLHYCNSDSIDFFGTELDKKDVALYIVLNEIVVFTFIIAAYNLILFMQNEFAKSYEDSKKILLKFFIHMIRKMQISWTNTGQLNFIISPISPLGEISPWLELIHSNFNLPQLKKFVWFWPATC